MTNLVQQLLQTYVASLETIWLRSLYLTPVWGSLSPWQRIESTRMVSEKRAAWSESQLEIALAPWTFGMRVTAELWRAAFAAGMSPILGRSPIPLPLQIPQMLGRASQATMVKVLHPYRSRTTQNAKRLKRRAVGLKR